jgi:hypothetical protein
MTTSFSIICTTHALWNIFQPEHSEKSERIAEKFNAKKKVIFLELRTSNKNLIDEASQCETISLDCIFPCFIEGNK